jgi:hypothetical protein
MDPAEEKSLMTQAAERADRLRADLQRQRADLANYPPALVAGGDAAMSGVMDALTAVLAAFPADLSPNSDGRILS